MGAVTHLDSCLLRGALDPNDKSEHRSESRHLMNSSPDTCFRISILAVGETLGKMAEVRDSATCAEAAAELSRLLRAGKMELHGIGRGGEALRLAVEMMKSDHMLTPTDAVLMACASMDPECTAFATTDKMLAENMVIAETASTHGVKIVDARRPVRKKGVSQLGRAMKTSRRQTTGSTSIMKAVGRNRNHKFYAKADLGPYMGEWVAICDAKIVTHRATFKEVFEEAKRICPTERPLFTKVPTGETMIF